MLCSLLDPIKSSKLVDVKLGSIFFRDNKGETKESFVNDVNSEHNALLGVWCSIELKISLKSTK